MNDATLWQITNERIQERLLDAQRERLALERRRPRDQGRARRLSVARLGHVLALRSEAPAR